MTCGLDRENLSFLLVRAKNVSISSLSSGR